MQGAGLRNGLIEPQHDSSSGSPRRGPLASLYDRAPRGSVLCAAPDSRSLRCMTNPLTSGVDHFALRAYDFDATVRFYTDGLGFTKVYEWISPGLVNRSAFLDAGDGRYLEVFDGDTTAVPGAAPTPLAELPRPSAEERARHASVVHVALRAADVDAAYARAIAAGATDAAPPFDIEQTGSGGYPDMTIRVGFVTGLDGEIVEFIRHEDFAAVTES